ncbi:uncharacterized protein BX663DRAFT_89150 [Cokeromyces recurvatus]|uniref:uncharacterized protein n=1 Tax=Cokeromyces recurvatus TaxID=90255 RepID=UPI00221EA05D|nr:uncharacterized protein BX663DRAFT_89150 [Cokeromyces recurvatus]KAI7901800.1 hypothetical protein BX663DRAFT_89150 [Cokeromyces recurvatus]
MTQTPTSPISPTPLHTSFFNGFINNNSYFTQQQDSLTSHIKDEISTIFVVGFPEDMQEREFQNMFMFSPGFEAATLKIPTTKEGGGGGGEDENFLFNNHNKKQIIGFAKFRTRKEAIDARDILNGRRIDAEKGCLLKAEMAKKNLHTKRGLLNETQQQQVQNNQSFHFLQQKQYQNPFNTTTTTTTTTTNTSSAVYEAFHSVPQQPVPNELISPNESYSDIYSDLMSTQSDSAYISRSQSLDARSMDLFVTPSISTSRFNTTNNNRFTSSVNFTDGLDYLSKSTPTTDRTFQSINAFFHNINSSSSPPPLSASISTGMTRVMDDNHNYYTQHQSTYHNEYSSFTNTRFHPLHSSSSTPPKSSSSTTSLPLPLPLPSSSPSILSPTSSYRSLGGILVGSSNPADQNPPCNTLYVGNLPPNTNEDELRAMFSKCSGYKRLSFRNKSNGPMCFVEFEDAIYAAQALQELHGNPLSNSIKGGIRLSFSKNPLGVRQNTVNNNSYPLMSAFSKRETITTANSTTTTTNF